MNNRLYQLDSLRGVAAMSVMLCHLALVFPIIAETQTPDEASFWLKLTMFSPFRILWAGHEAVIFFFILSGFVLALIFLGPKAPQPYPLYLSKRFIRIYPPYLISVLLAIYLRETIYNGPISSVSDWFNRPWKSPASSSVIMDHILMVPTFSYGDFNPVIWSLVHEMRISIVFPVIMWTMARINHYVLLLPIGFTTAHHASAIFGWPGINYFLTLHYAGFFVVGAYLAKHRQEIQKEIINAKYLTTVLILLCAVLLYTNTYWFQYKMVSELPTIVFAASKLWLREWITAGGVVIFITLATSSSIISNLLLTKPLKFLGAISYSLYLYHTLVIMVAVNFLVDRLPLIWILTTSAVTAVLVATISWRYVELPCIRLGSYVTHLWFGKNWRPKMEAITPLKSGKLPADSNTPPPN